MPGMIILFHTHQNRIKQGGFELALLIYQRIKVATNCTNFHELEFVQFVAKFLRFLTSSSQCFDNIAYPDVVEVFNVRPHSIPDGTSFASSLNL